MLEKRLIENLLSMALSTGGDFAELFVEDKFNTGIRLLGGKVERSMSGRDFGVGIRIFYGFNSVYAYTNQHDGQALIKMVQKAAKAVGNQSQDVVLNLINQEVENKHRIEKIPQEIMTSDKILVMADAYHAAKAYSSEIEQVTVGYMDEDQKVLIANTEGRLVEDRRIRTRLMIEAIAVEGQEMQNGTILPGAYQGFEFFDSIDVKEQAREAARVAVTMLHGDLCPSGKMPVVIENEFGGVIFHEACGHGLEATSVAKKNSVFADQMGQQVASELVTAIDDGTIANAWGSMNIDDEGETAQKNILIENGILKGYMVDKLNGRRMGAASTGSGRRQSYKYAPTSRMTNTYIAAGKSQKAEMISSTAYGIYAKKMGGGSVNPATGDFNFAVMEAYLIENGKIGRPVKGATLIGNGPAILKKIDMVGDNLGHGQGMCGSVSGSIPVNVGQPTIRVSEITVGGRKGE